MDPKTKILTHNNDSKRSKVFRKFNSVILEDTIEDEKIKEFNSRVERQS